MEVIGLDSQVKEQLVKYFSSHLCPNVPGQVNSQSHTHVYTISNIVSFSVGR